MGLLLVGGGTMMRLLGTVRDRAGTVVVLHMLEFVLRLWLDCGVKVEKLLSWWGETVGELCWYCGGNMVERWW